jgi:hypothetical protein
MTNIDPSAHEMIACCLWAALMLAIAVAVADLLDERKRR